jgi:hypothetical protein
MTHYSTFPPQLERTASVESEISALKIKLEESEAAKVTQGSLETMSEERIAELRDAHDASINSKELEVQRLRTLMNEKDESLEAAQNAILSKNTELELAQKTITEKENQISELNGTSKKSGFVCSSHGCDCILNYYLTMWC